MKPGFFSGCHPEKMGYNSTDFLRVATLEKAGFHEVNQKKKSGACPEKNLGGRYSIFFQVHALDEISGKNLKINC